MQNNDQKQIAAAILLAGVLIAGAILLKGSKSGKQGELSAGTIEIGKQEVSPISGEDHILGNPDAKTVIVEYSDTECPFCKVFHGTMQKVVENSDGEVAWVYRHYPIASLHPKAFKEALATECAFEQGGNDAFWKYINRLFEITPSNNALEESELSNIAGYVGLNVEDFKRCLGSDNYKEKIEADMKSGDKAGVNGTPSSFILKNGTMIDTISGAQPYEAIIEKLKTL